MKAASIKETGPAENIVFGDLPDPNLQPGEALVRVGAVSVNPIDTYIRGGLIAMELPIPYVVGCDLAGIVEAVGSEARDFKVGDRVWGSNQGLLSRQGTFSELAAVDTQWLYPTPDSVSDETAAAASLVGITAHLGLVKNAGLKQGEIIFVNGGSGGVGSTVIQMAKALGASVIASAGSDEKVEACKALGADHAFNYKTGKLEEAIQSTAPEGVHVWWETTREPNFDKIVASLAQDGRIVLMAGRDARPEFPVGPFYIKCCSIHGFVMFLASAADQKACAKDINRWLEEGKLKPKIDRVLPLSETAAAHKLQEENTIGKAGTLAGKIVLKP